MVLDTLRRFHIEEENASGPMAQVIGRMEAIAADTGCSIGHCCKVSDEAAFCLIQRPYVSKTLLTRRISPRGSP